MGRTSRSAPYKRKGRGKKKQTVLPEEPLESVRPSNAEEGNVVPESLPESEPSEIKKEPRVDIKVEDDGNLSDASTIPEPMDSEEGCCISPKEDVANNKDVLRIKIKAEPSKNAQNNSEDATALCFFPAVKEEKAQSSVLDSSVDNGRKQEDECNSDSDDSVIIIPVQKPPPKVVELLEDDAPSTNLPSPLTAKPVDKMELVSEWNIANNSESEKIENGNDISTITISNNGEECDAEVTPELMLKSEYHKDENKKERESLQQINNSIKQEAMDVCEVIGDKPIKQEPVCKVADDSKNGSNLENIVSNAMMVDEIVSTRESEAVPELLLKSEHATASNETKSKSDTIEENLKILRSRIKKEAVDNATNVGTESNLETCTPSDPENVAKEFEKGSLVSNDKSEATEPSEIEKESHLFGNETQESEVARVSRVSDIYALHDILKYLHLNADIKEDDLEMGLKYLTRYEPKRDRFRKFFEGPELEKEEREKCIERRQSITQHPSLQGEGLIRTPSAENLVSKILHPLPETVSQIIMSKVKIKVEKDQSEISNEKLQNTTQKPSATLLSLPKEKPVCIPQPENLIPENILTKEKLYPAQKNKINLEKDGEKISNKVQQNIRPQISTDHTEPICAPKPVTVISEKLHSSPDPSFLSKENLEEILKATGMLPKTVVPCNQAQVNFENSAVGPSSTFEEPVDTNEKQFGTIAASSSSLSTIPSFVPTVPTELKRCSTGLTVRKRISSDAEKNNAKKQKVDDFLMEPLTHNSPNAAVPISCHLSQRNSSIHDAKQIDDPVLKPISFLNLPHNISFGQISTEEQSHFYQHGSTHPSQIPPQQQIPHFSASNQAFSLNRNVGFNNPEEFQVATNVNMLQGTSNVNRDPRRQNTEAARYRIFQNRIGTETSLTQFRFQNIGKVPVTREFPFFILQWNPAWLQAQKNVQRIPPICEAYPIVQTDYQNELEYYNTYVPLHTLSVWLRMYDSWLRNPPVLNLRCDSVEPKAEYTNIICSVTLRNENGWPKRDDVVLCKGVSSDGSTTDFFGRVIGVSMRSVENSDLYKLKVEIHCLLPYRKFSAVNLQILFNIRISLLQCQALQKINGTLVKLVLNPTAYKRRICNISGEANTDAKVLRDRITNAVKSPENQVVAVDTSNVSDYLSFLSKVTYVLQANDFLVFLCLKSDRLFREVSHRLKPYEPVIVVRTKEVTLNQEQTRLTLEYRKDPSQFGERGEVKSTSQVFKESRIIVTLFSGFAPKDSGLLPAFNKRNVVCIVDDADVCIEAETALPLTYSVNKLVLLGKPSRPSNLPPQLRKYNYDLSLFKRFLQVT